MILRLSVPAVLGLCLAVWPLATSAQELLATPDGHVLDLAGILDATAEARIERVLAETLAATGIDMDVVTIVDIAAQGGGSQDLEAYARELFEAWNGGTDAGDDGLLLVVSTDPADARVALGRDYPPVYDARAARVLGIAVLPAFREGRIPEGIEAGVLMARDQVILPYLAGEPITATEGFATPVQRLPSTLPYFLGAVLVLGTGAHFLWRRARARKTCPRCGELTLNRTCEVIEVPSRSSPGSGIEHQLCKSCGFTDREVYMLRAGIGGGYRKRRIK